MPPKSVSVNREHTDEGSGWKSKFPLARIKKIMQADDDVGKVAQVTPVIVSKALELFMSSIVSGAVKHTLEHGTRKVCPGHLKLAVIENEMFDFLVPIVEKVPDASLHLDSVGVRAGEKAKKEIKERKPRVIKKKVEEGIKDEAGTASDSDPPKKKRKRVKAEGLMMDGMGVIEGLVDPIPERHAEVALQPELGHRQEEYEQQWDGTQQVDVSRGRHHGTVMETTEPLIGNIGNTKMEPTTELLPMITAKTEEGDGNTTESD